jgi:hypothetical protein
MYSIYMLGTQYYVEPQDPHITYEIVTDPTRLSFVRHWKHNRPPDASRVKEVEAHLRDTNVSDGQILLAIVNGECICYDGSHRLEAVKKYFPNGGIQVRIINNSSDKEVREEFTRINKSIPVPELYFSEDEVVIRLMTIVQNTVKGLCEHYSEYVSTSRKPRRPNFNRDVFTEELSDCLRETLSNENIIGLDETSLGTILTQANTTIRRNHYQKNPRIKASPKILEKCELKKFYFFASDWKDILKQLLSKD